MESCRRIRAERVATVPCAVLLGAILGALVGCGAGPAGTVAPVGVPETVDIGGMPGEFSVAPSDSAAVDSTAPAAPLPSTTTALRAPLTGPLVDVVAEQRVLLIGDTSLFATSVRQDGAMCEVLSGFGWDVAVEAEPGRPIEFADEVLDEIPVDDWSVVGLSFGHHLDGSAAEFGERLDSVLARIGDRPVIVYTVVEIGAEQVDVNRIVRERARERPNVVLVDWSDAAAADPDTLLVGGGPRVSAEGADRLVLLTAALLSATADGRPGECSQPSFTDDTAIVL